MFALTQNFNGSFGCIRVRHMVAEAEQDERDAKDAEDGIRGDVPVEHFIHRTELLATNRPEHGTKSQMNICSLV